MTEHVLTYLSAADLLDEFLDRWLNDQVGLMAGHEQEALIELVRSADLHAYLLNCFAPPRLTNEFAHECVLNRAGIGAFLRLLLPKMEHLADGIRWLPSTKKNAAWADSVLVECGKLTLLRRLAHCERYGLVRCVMHSDQHISIFITSTDTDSLDRADHLWTVAAKLESQQNVQEHLDRQMKGWAKNRIDQYVSIHNHHFIRYDSDWDLHALYRQQVECSLVTSAEADALPDDVRLGPFSFGEWKQITVTGAARATLHLSFATTLSARHHDTLDLRNLLTLFVRHEDLLAVWSQQTNTADKKTLAEISDVFMLTAEHAEQYFRLHDSPLPYNIRCGKYFALLPQFGYLSNTCTFLVTQLRQKYRKDWDAAVNRREAKFQHELYTLLGAGKYRFGRENFVIYRNDGTRETDIDAALFEVNSNSVYLIQLKWFDVVAYSLQQRESKITNLLKANTWVNQVSRWAASLPTNELLSKLGLMQQGPDAAPVQIRIIVLTRTAAQFGGDHNFDERASWISWPTLCRLISENKNHDSPLEAACQKDRATKAPQAPPNEPKQYLFPRLRIDIYR